MYKDLYGLLGIESTADSSEIRKAYRQAALRTHPDKLGGSAHEFHAISIAFEVLSSSSARHLYDRSLGCSQATQQPCSWVRTIPQTPCNLRSDSRVLQSKCASPGCEGLGGTNRQCMCNRRATTLSFAGQGDASLKKRRALSNLQCILQSMTSPLRNSSIQALPIGIQVSLANFMRTSEGAFEATTGPGLCSQNHPRKAKQKAANQKHRVPSSGFSGVRATSGLQYKAYMDIKALRFYARGQLTIEAAIEDHAVLIKLRHCLLKAGGKSIDFWSCGDKVYGICIALLKSLETSEDGLGLSVIVSLRATRWLGRAKHITSSMLRLKEALDVHSKLLSARGTSWNHLRDECVHLMVRKKRSLQKGLSIVQAQSEIDAARQRALQLRFTRAVRQAANALEEERRKITIAQKKETRRMALEKRQKRQESTRALAEQRRISKLRLRWMRRRDLTTEELLSGPPSFQKL